MPNAYQDRPHAAANGFSVEDMIAELLRAGFTTASIGNRCGSSRSTIARLLQRAIKPSPALVGAIAVMHRKYCRPQNVARPPIGGKL